jgi:type III secretion system HrpE/YscL family protein
MTPTIIKANTASARGIVIRRPVVEAAEEARAIVEHAETEREAVREQARQEGYQSGLVQWNETLAAAFVARDEYLARNEAMLVRLAVRLAEKVIGEELRSDPGTILRIVRESLRTVRRERHLLLTVNPTEKELVRARIEELRVTLGGTREIEVAGDPKVAPGGCIVESELGIIDAQVSTQLACLEQALLRTARRDQH